MKRYNLFLAIGQFALAISILLNHFVKESHTISFIIGFLTAISIVFNFAFIINWRKENNK
jgi:hypothetical protein